MFIALNGQLGSGKTALCALFRDLDGYDIFSTGKIQREYANELGISTLELNERSKTDYSYDYAIDKKLMDYGEANRGKNIVFDSRMAWHFLEDVYKVHLLIRPATAADRVFGKRESKEETYKSREEAMSELVKRRDMENDRYNKVYNVNMYDFRNYDLILDTTKLTPEETYKIILREASKKTKEQAVYVAPNNIYPSRKKDVYSIEEAEQLLLKELNACTRIPTMSLIKIGENLFTYEKENLLLACNLADLKLIKADKVYTEDEILPNGQKAIDYIEATMEDIKEWEMLNNFSFDFYPENIK